MVTITLPHPNIDFVPLDILTAAEQNQLVANINALATFANGLADGANLSPAVRGDYSTSEVDTGRKWVDGRSVYQKTIQGVVDLQAGSSAQIPHGITGLTDNRVFVDYQASLSLGSTTGPASEVLPRVEHQHQAGIQHLGKTHLVAAGSWPWGSSRYIITLWYVK
nr:MAG TPA: hypothetical protein [Caudoviricetes sp.]